MIKLNKKSIKKLSGNSVNLSQGQTPKVAGGGNFTRGACYSVGCDTAVFAGCATGRNCYSAPGENCNTVF
ncbi:hypothetical protein BGP78_08010 [Pseudoalteromonas sp. MSK9-3]|uniref:Uncharacterized protein n=2 Tax=Pseudoalteromonas citrea TaxID=43655 RepID=A0AAD4ALN5_9GAMM|nr:MULTISPECIES: hypothetical protein [Pseudoalteromonas]KAF7774544.1 hypothetical protein PCIT_a1006 [Pseudoalteromonas citrea]RJE77715.1 hypothetical protein BGP78_08010 [Pseudoalteromonas sp. MSK9-3]